MITDTDTKHETLAHYTPEGLANLIQQLRDLANNEYDCPTELFIRETAKMLAGLLEVSQDWASKDSDLVQLNFAFRRLHSHLSFLAAWQRDLLVKEFNYEPMMTLESLRLAVS